MSAKLIDLGVTVNVLNFYLKDNLNYLYKNGHSKLGTTLVSSYSAMWARLKPCINPNDKNVTIYDDDHTSLAVYGQWTKALAFFYSECTGIVLNSTNPLADNKISEIKTAIDVGLKVPQTLITNDSNEVLNKISSNRIIYKPLRGMTYEPGTMIYANVLSRETITKEALSISYVPAIFQEYVEKSYEIRAFAFGETCFCVKINSQALKLSKIDWRKNTYDAGMFEAYSLNVEEKRLLLDYLEKQSLKYGLFDLIREPSGELVFLECNPEGQWLFMEEATGQNMTTKFADFFYKLIISSYELS